MNTLWSELNLENHQISYKKKVQIVLDSQR